MEDDDLARGAGQSVAATSHGADAQDAHAGPENQGGHEAIAQFDYEKAEENELELREGERVYNIDMVDEDWWMGENSRGEKGLFPSNYVELVEGTIQVKGAPNRSVTFAQVAREAYNAVKLPDGMEPGLQFTRVFDPPNYTFPFGTHIAVVEIDPEIGAVELTRFVAVDDAGTIINPLLAHGQVHGGIAQAVAQALIEEVLFDEDGNPLTSTFADYCIISAPELPLF